MGTRAGFFAVAVVAASLLSSGASAIEGTTTAMAPLRVGPDETYPVIGTVDAGAALKIHSCLVSQAWCLVRIAGRSGWVRADQVKAGGFSKARRYFDPAANVSLEFQVFDDELADGPAFGGPGFPAFPFHRFKPPRLSDKRLPQTFTSTISTPGFRLHKQGFPVITGGGIVRPGAGSNGVVDGANGSLPPRDGGGEGRIGEPHHPR